MSKTFYHLSKSDKVYINAAIHGKISNNIDSKLFGNEFSDYGINVLNTPILPLSIEASVRNFREFLLEWVRQREFPDLPSRLSCYFCVKEFEDLKLWSNKLISRPIINIIESDVYFEADSKLLDVHDNDFSLQVAAFRKYWSGNVTDDPILEALIPFPITITNSISSSLILND